MKKIFIPALLFQIVTAFAQVPTSGLTHAYTFNNQNANDEVGNINGVMSNCTSATDRFGNSNKAYSFNGINSAIDLGISNNLMSANGTVSIWVMKTGLATNSSNMNYDPIFEAKNLSTGAYFEGAAIGVNRTSGAWLAVNTANSVEKVVSKTGVTDNAWHHAVLAYDTDSVRFYIDGVLAGRIVKGFASQFSTTLNAFLGYTGNTAYKGYFKGGLDDLRIYNRVLSKTEVLSLYNEPTPATPNVCTSSVLFSSSNLKHQYSFNCPNANDEVGNINGIISNATFTADRFTNSEKALSFNGTASYVDLGVSNALMSVTGSVSIWVNRTGNAATNSNLTYDPIFVAKNPSTGAFFEGVAIGAHRTAGYWFVINTLNGSEKAVTKTGITDNEWHHVVLTYDADFVSFYLDGTYVGQTAKGFASQFSTSLNAYLGYSGNTSYKGYFNGALDDLLLFDKALTPNEVTNLFNIGNPVTALTEFSEKTDKAIFPNPVKDILNVKGSAEIYNLTGQKVLQGQDKINVSELNTGIYIVISNNKVSRIIKE